MIMNVDNMNNENRLNCTHRLSFWTSFPLFTRIVLLHSPHLARELDSNNELPLHIIARDIFDKCAIRQCSICHVFPIIGPFHWYPDEGIHVCRKCIVRNIPQNPPNSPVIPAKMPFVEYQCKPR